MVCKECTRLKVECPFAVELSSQVQGCRTSQFPDCRSCTITTLVKGRRTLQPSSNLEPGSRLDEPPYGPSLPHSLGNRGDGANPAPNSGIYAPCTPCGSAAFKISARFVFRAKSELNPSLIGQAPCSACQIGEPPSLGQAKIFQHTSHVHEQGSCICF
jgi:hypothetical protein